MKDEIIQKFLNKEIYILQDNSNLPTTINDVLLDYITNLQTIEQQYSAILSENAELENKITNLQEENERLKEWKKDLLDENIDLENIRKEAIEYIENNKQLSMFADLRKEGTHQYDLECDADDLLEILQGKSDE